MHCTGFGNVIIVHVHSTPRIVQHLTHVRCQVIKICQLICFVCIVPIQMFLHVDLQLQHQISNHTAKHIQLKMKFTRWFHWIKGQKVPCISAIVRYHGLVKAEVQT
jgi:hypothetical protein